VTSRARQLAQATALTAGHGRIVAVFFDAGESRVLAWPRRPQAAALVAAITQSNPTPDHPRKEPLWSATWLPRWPPDAELNRMICVRIHT
jgi:hypothetical protein